MSLIRPDFWIPHLSVYAFSVIQHQPQDNPEVTIHTVAPLDYVVAIFMTAGLLVGQAFLLGQLIHHGRRWYASKGSSFSQTVDADPTTRTQANRTLLALLTSAFLGGLTIVSCILLCANFMMRIWALGYIVDPDDVRYGGRGSDNRINCSFGIPHCISLRPAFGIAVENLEQATAFFMTAVVFIASGLLVHRNAVIFRSRLWIPSLTGVPLLVFVVSTIAGIVAVYRNPYHYARQAGWLYYRYQSSDTYTHTQTAIARITPTISTVALVALNIVFSVCVLATALRAQVRTRACTLVIQSALPSAIIGIALFFVPSYGADASHPFYYMRLARYSLRTLWAALFIIAPQVMILRTMRSDRKEQQRADEKTFIELEVRSVKEV
ncbi:hypothetical protein NMY22_g2121 [Coprinellus aureogranulatus]|nr:hypothetical protein NMY22_g2121 [Coprinellus aureogranulatus]